MLHRYPSCNVLHRGKSIPSSFEFNGISDSFSLNLYADCVRITRNADTKSREGTISQKQKVCTGVQTEKRIPKNKDDTTAGIKMPIQSCIQYTRKRGKRKEKIEIIFRQKSWELLFS